MNKIILTGRLVKDPVVKTYTKDKEIKSMTRFTLAVNRAKDKADFISCIAFDNIASIITMYGYKGQLVGVVGELHAGSYKNKEQQYVNFAEVAVSSFEMLSSKSDRQQSTGGENTKESQDDMFYDCCEELPFR